MSAISSRLFCGRRERAPAAGLTSHPSGRRERGGPGEERGASRHLSGRGACVCGCREAAGGPEQEDQSGGSLCGGEEEDQ
ncbi:hypothetical protein CgunFtcFv8_018884 [Champsocephalus gunnari]|uniref:Uncharacterized protein n=1 Tax=Champsocephalus gunnari TaxID=52237 RepID=A0AAN8DEY2_CHAGU|nr:hypothetical protein CgunFtcFv8_018884 [Champsocephalus gunnari]